MNSVITKITEKVYNIFAEDVVLPIDENETFRNLGVDSIDYAALVIELEDEFNIDLIEDDVPWHTINTIQKLAAVIDERIR